jgi:tetratricopeptide (TPR) repeat protein
MDLKNIKERQRYFALGQQFENEGDLEKAISNYRTYADYLADKDYHIPFQWISNMYKKLHQEEASLDALSVFAKGSNPPIAAKWYKEIGDRYLEINNVKAALNAYRLAVENNPNIGLKKKISQLEN